MCVTISITYPSDNKIGVAQPVMHFYLKYIYIYIIYMHK